MGHTATLFHLLVIVSVWTSVVAAGGDKHDCHTLLEYHELMGLTHHGCSDIFSELHNLFKIGPVCGQTVVTTLASFYHTNHVACHCTGSYTLPIYPPDHKNLLDQHLACMHVSGHYTKLYNEYFQDPGQTATAQCTTYQRVWGELKNLMTESMPCYDDMILHLSKAYEHVRPDCHCHEGAAVTHPPITMAPTTMPPTTMVPTTTAPTTTASTTTAPVPYVNSGAMTLPLATTTDIAMHCSNVTGLGFDKLLLFLTTDECASANTVWGYLNQVMAINPACMDTLLKYLAVKYQNGNPTNCECHPLGQIHNVYLAHTKCRDVHEGTFKEIYGNLFEYQDHHGCEDHSYLWTRLMGIRNHYLHPDYSCQHQLIVLAAVVYPIGSQTPCVCTSVNPARPVTTMAPVPTTTRPTQAPTQAPTTAVTTTTTTTSTAAPTTTVPTTLAATTTMQTPSITPVVTTTLAPSPTTTHKDTHIDACFSNPCQNGGACLSIGTTFFCACTYGWAGTMCEKDASPTCEHRCVLLSVVDLQPVFNNGSLTCPDTSKASNEAFPMTCCGLETEDRWQKGRQLMPHCSEFPEYTPIASFQHGRPVKDTAGIFLMCAEGGFKYIRQSCNSIPDIITINHSNQTDSTSFYVIY